MSRAGRQQIGREMGRERIGQAKLGCEHCAERAHRRIHNGTCVPAAGTAQVARTGRSQERLQFKNIAREALCRLGRAAQGLQRQLVSSRRTAKSEIDAAREQALQGFELFGDDIGGMIGSMTPPAPTRMRPDPAAM